MGYMGLRKRPVTTGRQGRRAMYRRVCVGRWERVVPALLQGRIGVQFELRPVCRGGHARASILLGWQRF